MPQFVERFSLSGKRALVTGASKGIGAKTAAVLADAGADLAIVGRDRAGLERTAAEIAAMGRECLIIEDDLQAVEGPRDAGQRALDRFGTIDILVNNAGVVHVKTIFETTMEAWDETMAVNLRAPFLLAQVLAPKMIEQRSGKIINVSSLAGTVGAGQHAVYNLTKAGLDMLTKVMTGEWAQYNIQANSVAPTITMTEMAEKIWSDPAKADPMKARTPMHRFGQPIEIADLILYLASPASSFICGQTILVDGGYTAV